jgi:kynurenine--oxoglutarate transaminase/cysteine-S-conjugate beta-lyase/glutamine--phenylpyruvate transaminase
MNGCNCQYVLISLTGWRLGWAYGPAALIRNLQVASSNCVYAIETPAQEVIAATLELELKTLDTPESIFYKMRQDLRERRDIMVKIARNGGLEPVIPEAGIFLLANWKSLGK